MQQLAPSFLLLLLVACTGRAPQADAEVNTPEDPAPAEQIGEYVTEVFEDRGGHLWMGTLGRGIARHDGETLRYFTVADGLSAGAVTSIAEDAHGRLWVGTHGGVAVFDGASFSTVGPATDFPGSSVAADRQGRIWTSNGTQVFVHEERTPRRFELPVDPGAVSTYAIHPGRASFALEDRAGNLWFRTDGQGALRFDGASFERFTKADGLCSDTVNEIVEDADGNIWFACMQAFQPEMTGDGGLCRWDGETFTTFADLRGLAGGDLYSLHADRDGRVWVGATGHGIYRLGAGDVALFDDVERPDLTQHRGFQSIVQRRDGTIWLGMSGGLFRLDGERIVNVTHAGPWH